MKVVILAGSVETGISKAVHLKIKPMIKSSSHPSINEYRSKNIYSVVLAANVFEQARCQTLSITNKFISNNF